MKQYINAGYFLIKTRPIDFGLDINKVVETCSCCINLSAFDFWCLSWTNNNLEKEEKIELKLTDEKIKQIQIWADNKFDNGQIKWRNAFPNLETTRKFKKKFYSNQNDINIYTIYFDENDAKLLIDKFQDDNLNNGDFGIRHNLIAHSLEIENPQEEFLGYDFIGVEGDGSFHTFYCHNITQTIIDKFDLQLNRFGLFDTVNSYEEINEYLNNQETGLEPVPWYIVKTKRVKNGSHQ